MAALLSVLEESDPPQCSILCVIETLLGCPLDQAFEAKQKEEYLLCGSQ